MFIDDILHVRWIEFENNPIIYPKFPSWLIADPTFLPPQLSLDCKWHLFAHSIYGIYHYISNDGNNWQRLRQRVVRNGIRPFLTNYRNKYYLFYTKLINVHFPNYSSQIEVISSFDLVHWENPRIVFKPNISWHFIGGLYGSVGNPCIVEDDNNNFKLYYSSGHVYLKDCKFNEPKFIGCAFSEKLEGPYISLPEPILCPIQSDRYMNLGAGAIKVIRLSDGYVGFQNGIYWDDLRNHSGSAIRLLKSRDGFHWETTGDPILKPTDGWKRSHVYSLDAHFTNNQWYLYFNARSGWLFGRECIGYAKGI